MNVACLECGAPLRPGETCTDLLNRMLALEWRVIGELGADVAPAEFLASDGGDVALNAHLFAVGTYQLQHPDRLAVEAVFGLRDGIAGVLVGRTTLAETRLKGRQRFNGPQRVRRRGSLARDPALGPWPDSWPLTVADVCDLPPGGYIAAVRRWAETSIAAIAAVRGDVAARGR